MTALRTIQEGDACPRAKYVYAVEFLEAGAWVPRYVGVGTGRRVWNHLACARGTRRLSGANAAFIKALQGALSQPGRVRVRIHAEGRTTDEANGLEVQIIGLIGRVIDCSGPLLNALGGGASPDRESCILMRRRISQARRTDAALKAVMTKTVEQRRAAALKAAATKTPEQRSAAVRKAAATRRGHAATAPTVTLF